MSKPTPTDIVQFESDDTQATSEFRAPVRPSDAFLLRYAGEAFWDSCLDALRESVLLEGAEEEEYVRLATIETEADEQAGL